MKKIISIVFIISLISLGTISYLYKTPIKNSKSSGTNIIAFGDSLVFGVGSTSGNDIFSILSRKIGQPIINKGVSGNTTVDALARLESDVLNNDPRIVFVLLGGNDYLQKIPKETTFKNLATIIEKIQDKGAAVILLGVRGGIFVDRFEEDYKILSDTYQTGFVPNVLDGLITNRKLMFDSIHPNDLGYKIVADKIFPELKRLIDSND